MEEALKRVLGPTWQGRLRGFNRLRWITKYRLMRAVGTDDCRRRRVAYVLFAAAL